MSDPKRYTTNVGYGHEDNDGEFVLWDDYAKLQAEVSRLKMEESKLHDKIVNIGGYNHAVTRDNTALCRLRDELFRLGDAMAKESNTPASEAWVAFKEKAMNRYSDTPVDKKPPLL